MTHEEDREDVPAQKRNKDYSKIMDKFEERLDYMTEHHAKVLSFRFDVGYPSDCPAKDGREFKVLMRRLKEYVNEKKGSETHNVWVDEIGGKNGYLHRHVVGLVDGSKVQNSYGIKKEANRLWMQIIKTDKSGLVNFCNKRNRQKFNSDIMIKSPSPSASEEVQAEKKKSFKEDCERARLDHADYLAKSATKGSVPKGKREYGASVLKKEENTSAARLKMASMNRTHPQMPA